MKQNTFAKCVTLSIVSISIIFLTFVYDSEHEGRPTVAFSGYEREATYEEPDDEGFVFAGSTIADKKDGIIQKAQESPGDIIIKDESAPLVPLSYLAKDAGLVPNDKSKATDNANLLIEALNRSNKIIIDDSYYISTPSEVLTTRMVEITGTENGELISDNENSVHLFDTSALSNIILKDVKFRNDNNSSFLIVYNDNKIDAKVDSVHIQGCSFDGNISLYRHYGKTDIDPDSMDYGVGEFVFKNNRVSNTRYSFILLNDIPVDYCEVKDNSVQNFQYKFLSISISNGIPYENKLYKHIKYLKVDNNKVMCDDAWWGETSSGLYYTFVLYEGDEVLYNNNHVEGMKTLEKFAVYDAYLSSRLVNYTNNTWKNNICFAPDKSNNTLLKSKGGVGSPLVRNYSHNKFIVEEDFAKRVGQLKDNLFVYFVSLTQHADSYAINNNLFDVYDLRFPESSMSISDLAICGNTIRAKKASGNIAIVRLDDDYTTKSIDISDNTIEVDSKSKNVLNLLKVVDNRSFATTNIKSISVRNNRIAAPLGYVFYNAVAEKLDFLNNTITDTGSGSSGLAYSGKFTKSYMSGNLIESQNSPTFYEGRQLYGAGLKNEILRLNRNNTASGNNGLHLDIGYDSVVPTTYKRRYTIATQKGTYKFYYVFTLSYDSKNNCANVTFVNDKGKTYTYGLGMDSAANSGNGQFVDIINEGENEIEDMYRVCFFNNKGKAGFFITDYNCDFCEMKIETVNYQNN